MANSFKFNFLEDDHNKATEDTLSDGCSNDCIEQKENGPKTATKFKEHEFVPDCFDVMSSAMGMEPFTSYKLANKGTVETLFYASNKFIDQLIGQREGNKTVALSELLQHSDLNSGVYEGGFKVWECSLDLVTFLQTNSSMLIGKDVLELGCGAGLPGIYCSLSGSRFVYYQDYNDDVIDMFTIPNVLYNHLRAYGIEWHTAIADASNHFDNLMKKCKFLSGDWESCDNFLRKESRKFDIILSSETIYNPAYYPSLLKLIFNSLKTDGFALIASKSYYFGVGGGTKDFIDYVMTEDNFTIEIVMKITDGLNREILKLQWKK